MNFFTLKTKPRSHYHVRSISLQARSHPSTLKLEAVLNKLKTWKESSSSSSKSSETIHTALSGLGELYICIEELLALPPTQQALAQHQKWANELLEDSVRFVDVCSNTREAVSVTKEGLQELQSCLRRGRRMSIEAVDHVNAYVVSRKKMKKEVAKSLAAELKQTDDKLGVLLLSNTSESENYHFSAVIRVLRESNLITVSIFRLLLLFLSVPVPGKPRPRSSRWSLVSKLVHKGVVCDGQEKNNMMNELEAVEIALGDLLFCNSNDKGDVAADKIQPVLGRLGDLIASIESLESGLESLFRHLIRTRVSLLNILCNLFETLFFSSLTAILIQGIC